MTDGSAFDIALSEEFPHLGNAPIREAVLEIHTPGGAEWQESSAVGAIQARLTDYTDFKTMLGLLSEQRLWDAGRLIALASARTRLRSGAPGLLEADTLWALVQSFQTPVAYTGFPRISTRRCKNTTLRVSSDTVA